MKIAHCARDGHLYILQGPRCQLAMLIRTLREWAEAGIMSWQQAQAAGECLFSLAGTVTDEEMSSISDQLSDLMDKESPDEETTDCDVPH